MILKKPQYKLRKSQYRLRKAVGYLGILLPVILVLVQFKILPSLSAYYYSSSSIFFISILTTFGLILIYYEGYKKKEGEKLSDNLVTTITGVSVIITVLVPTRFLGLQSELTVFGANYLFGHTSCGFGVVHYISAGVFIFLLGWMCVKNFVKNGSDDSENCFYRTCGYIIWCCLGILIVLLLISKFSDFEINKTKYVTVLETIAIWAFGFAWLKKGKALKDWKELKTNFIKKLTK